MLVAYGPLSLINQLKIVSRLLANTCLLVYLLRLTLSYMCIRSNSEQVAVCFAVFIVALHLRATPRSIYSCNLISIGRRQATLEVVRQSTETAGDISVHIAVE